MFVSYVVATYNCADRVETLNETIRRLPAAECEFCISDGASSDDTIKAISSGPNVRVLRSSKDSGIYDAWNQVLDDCRGEYVAFIGVDDEPTADFLKAAKQVHAQSAEPPLLMYGDRVLQRGRYRRTLPYSGTPALLEAERPVFDIPHQAALNHRSLFESVRFDAQFQLAGDLDFYLAVRDRIRDGGYRHLPLTQVIASEEGLSRSASSFDIYRREFRAIEEKRGITLGYDMSRLRALGLIAKVPGLFGLLKGASWMIKHDR